MGFEIGKLTRLPLGYQGESNSRTLEIDVQEWLDKWPGAAVNIMVRRPGETEYYPAASQVEDGILIWAPTRADLFIAGKGEAQIILTDENDVELRTRVVETIISPSIAGTEGEAPEAMEGWVHQVLQAAQGVEEAVDKMPAIGENGNWMLWDPEAKTHVDTGMPSKGKDGEDGYTPVKGTDYFDGEPGYTPVKGKDYFDGSDGVSPTVEVTPITDGHRVTITDANGSKYFDVMDGADGEGGGGNAEAGEDGGYYIPTVVDAVLSWTASKSEMPAVPSADIRGPKGEDGYTPVKGTDYWTEADRQTIVDDVLAALPTAEGVSF